METNQPKETDIVLSSTWPEDIIEPGRLFNVERPGADQDILEEVVISKEPATVDFKHLSELMDYSEKGSSQLAYLVKNWEHKQEKAVRLLREELDTLSKQQQEVELKKLEILEEHRIESDGDGGYKRPISTLDENLQYVYHDTPQRKNDVIFEDETLDMHIEYDSTIYWKQRAMHLEKLLEASLQREQVLQEKLHESTENLERQSTPVEELSQLLKRADNFLHFILQNAPVVLGHQDKELRYRFACNQFPSLLEEDFIGKTDVEIFSGSGVKESQEFKREVLYNGIPAKREITFETDLFGYKTFLIYVEPVFNKMGESIGINYMGMDITVQVRKRERMAKLQETMAVQKAKDTELNKTFHIKEEAIRAKQILATMSEEIRSPLSEVVSMAEILSTTKLDKEQQKLSNVIISSSNLVLQLINDILDLSKVDSVMKLESTKFRPREIVTHILQTAAVSVQKLLTLEGYVANDVPTEVIGDAHRFRQILTNLISNGIKFTHEGKVGIKVYVIAEPPSAIKQGSDKKISSDQSKVLPNIKEDDKCLSISQSMGDQIGTHRPKDGEDTCGSDTLKNEPNDSIRNEIMMDEDKESLFNTQEKVVWICCDIYDTGIGIPVLTLFKEYMQVGADTAGEDGGTGLSLAICKQLVELMGGHLTLSNKEHCWSTFTFVLPFKVLSVYDSSNDLDEVSDMASHDVLDDANDDDLHPNIFLFPPRSFRRSFD
ncbi:histidine kinase 5-like isoform X1 [Olea europaea var. sylvestris]|uniref:histidine kinase 5-like isoform X1 n=1 Tax=Olea europaea var. sylvestris TaxID=158386 RepID=UPI000C1CE54E|nr:histidine kinase 5-like isoform X1 [Olea europaea var. sylvestris]XP_022874360.1 histidine kinase 5-like isoform X1 [Olea europaea var. sylvestris]